MLSFFNGKENPPEVEFSANFPPVLNLWVFYEKLNLYILMVITLAHLDGIEIVQELALRTQMMTTFEF